MLRKMETRPQWQRLNTRANSVGVDREARVIRGYTVAQEGVFKTPGRGYFDSTSLFRIERIMREAEPRGVRSHFGHHSISNDGLGTFLGRARNARRAGDRVRADLHLDHSAFTSPRGDLGSYLMDIAESDPDGISSSLQLKVKILRQLDEHGREKVDADGNTLPPLWLPEKITASDVVSVGDSVDGLLSAGIDLSRLAHGGALWRGEQVMREALNATDPATLRAELLRWLSWYTDSRCRKLQRPEPPCPVSGAAGLLDRVLGGQPADVIRARATAYLERVMTRHGPTAPAGTEARLRDRLAAAEARGRRCF